MTRSAVGPKSERVGCTLSCPCERKSPLNECGDTLHCEGVACNRVFPIIGGTPILINEDSSVFRIAEILKNRERALELPSWRPRMRQFGKSLVKYIPAIDINWKARQNLSRLRQLLLQQQNHSQVLIIGAGAGDRYLESILGCPNVTLVRSDVYLAPTVDMVADAHDLPFDTGSFDAIVCQSVLEHVADPFRCVEEIHRVLRPGGLVYAEVPFMQQVHAKAYDFTRFTLGGLRRLFRTFDLIDAGVEGGPGMALAWSVSWFFRMLSASAAMEIFVYFVLPFFLFWLKYVDYFFIDTPRAADGASELYFMGKRSDCSTLDREIIAGYWRETGIHS